MSTQEETIEVGMQVVQLNITEWYKRRHVTDPTQRLTRARLTKNKIGSPSDPQLKIKGAETHGVCIWLVEQLVLSQIGTEASAFRVADADLLRLVGLWRPYGWVVLGDVVEEVMRACQRFLTMTSFANMALPERHQVFHMIRDATVFGNPRKYATWHDGSSNRLSKKAGRAVSQRTFEEDVVLRMRALLSSRGTKRHH